MDNNSIIFMGMYLSIYLYIYIDHMYIGESAAQHAAGNDALQTPDTLLSLIAADPA